MDTNSIKRQAFFDVLVPAGVPESIVRDAVAAVSGDRYQVIAEALRRASLVLDIDVLADRYNEIAEAAQSVGPEVPGAAATLARLAGRVPLYVNSATPEAPLRRSIAYRGWSSYFKATLGRPAGKTENLRMIAALEGVPCRAIVFIGDQASDLAAARACGCRFVAFRREPSTIPTEVESVTRLDDVVALVGP